MVVGIVHIINTGFESDRSLNAAAAERSFLATSDEVSLFRMACTTSPKSYKPAVLGFPENQQRKHYREPESKQMLDP